MQVKDEEYSLTRIDEILGINKRTVSREIKRNQADGIYQPTRAQSLKNERRQHCKKNVVLVGRLEQLVYRLVKKDWSPDQISNTLLIRRELHISHENIYKYIRKNRDSGGSLYTHLRQKKQT
jgi:IS30 family transposase